MEFTVLDENGDALGTLETPGIAWEATRLGFANVDTVSIPMARAGIPHTLVIPAPAWRVRLNSMPPLMRGDVVVLSPGKITIDLIPDEAPAGFY